MGIVLGIGRQSIFQIQYSALPIICVPELVKEKLDPDKNLIFKDNALICACLNVPLFNPWFTIFDTFKFTKRVFECFLLL